MVIFGSESRTAALTIAAIVLASSAAFAQIATTLEQAELADLSPETRAEVQARAVHGNTVYEVLQTILLNNINAKHPGNRVVALDFDKGTAVVESQGGATKVVSFDKKTLIPKPEVSLPATYPAPAPKYQPTGPATAPPPASTYGRPTSAVPHGPGGGPHD